MPRDQVDDDLRIIRRSLHDEVVERLRDMIVSGQIAEDERIREKELCESIGVSRTPLREALKVLASEGLIELLPNRGARVIRLSISDFEQMFEVMAALEGLAGELACKNITDREIEEIRKLHDQMMRYYDRDEMLRLFRVDQEIHLKIVQATRNHILLNIYEGLAARLRRARFKGAKRDESQMGLMKDHVEMVTALSERQAARLGRIMRRHLRKKCDVVRALYFEEDTQS